MKNIVELELVDMDLLNSVLDLVVDCSSDEYIENKVIDMNDEVSVIEVRDEDSLELVMLIYDIVWIEKYCVDDRKVLKLK